MSGGGKSTSTTLNYSPEEAARRTQVMDEASRIYQATKGQAGYYPGAVPVGADAATLAGQQHLLQAAQQANALNPLLAQSLQYGLTGAMDVGNNPYFQSALEASLRPLQTQMTQGLQQVGSAAQQAGAYGGGRHGIAEALSFEKGMQSMGDVAAQMGNEAYRSGQGTFARTLAFAPSTIQSFGQGAQMESAVGAQRENLAQEQEAYRAAIREWQLNAPWMPLEQYANIVFNGGSSQSTASSSTPRNPLGAIGGAMAGYGLATMAPALGVTGPVGMAAGAILGALL